MDHANRSDRAESSFADPVLGSDIRVRGFHVNSPIPFLADERAQLLDSVPIQTFAAECWSGLACCDFNFIVLQLQPSRSVVLHESLSRQHPGNVCEYIVQIHRERIALSEAL